MAASLAQAAVTGSGAGGSTTLTLAGTTTTGNVLMLHVASGSTKATATGPASGQGGVTTWTRLASTTRRASEFWYGVVDTTPTNSVTFNNGFRGTASWALMEVQGLDTASLIHGTPLTANNQSGVTATGSFTPTASAEVFLVSMAAIQNNAQSNSLGTGWTDVLGSGFNPVAYQAVASASGSYSNSWTNANAFTVWDAQLVGFNVAAAGASESMGGTITPAGAVALQVTALILAGTITPAGAYSDDGGSGSPGPLSMGGTVTPEGELTVITVGFADGTMVGTITPVGALITEQTSLSALVGGNLTPYGGLVEADLVIGVSVSGAITPVGSPGVPTEIEHGLAGTITPAGAVTPTEYVGIVLLLSNRSGAD